MSSNGWQSFHLAFVQDGRERGKRKSWGGKQEAIKANLERSQQAALLQFNYPVTPSLTPITACTSANAVQVFVELHIHLTPG